MDNKFYFLINPISGNGKNIDFADKLISKLQKKGISTESLILQHATHAEELSLEIIKKDKTAILVAVGGDGTVNKIGKTILNTDATLAIVPRGSGNGLARTIQAPTLHSMLMQYFKYGEKHKIDAGQVNDQTFFCTCGFGFDAIIADVFNHSKSKKRGPSEYVKHILHLIKNYSGIYADFSLDGKNFAGEYFAVTISNANQYGNNAYIAPQARIDDGNLWATIIHPFPKALSPIVGAALMNGYIDKLPFVSTIPFKKAEIRSVSNDKFHIDGESIEMLYPAKISIQHEALQVFQPLSYQYQHPIPLNLNQAQQVGNAITLYINKLIAEKGKIPPFNFK